MVRPCYLVIDQEYAGSISTRKLVIETAKFNVITAYSSEEALETLRKYPEVDGIVLDAGMPDMPCQGLITGLKAIRQGTPIILVGNSGEHPCIGADFHLDSFNPARLLEVIQKLKPEDAQQVEQRNRELKDRN